MKKNDIGYWAAVILLLLGAWLAQKGIWSKQHVPLTPVPLVTPSATPTPTITPTPSA